MWGKFLIKPQKTSREEHVYSKYMHLYVMSSQKGVLMHMPLSYLHLTPHIDFVILAVFIDE